jgi:hypothetical protein
VPALFFAGAAGVVLVLPVVAVLVAAAFVPVAGRAAVAWVPIAGHWALCRAMRQDVFLVRPTRPRPAGTLALPGDAAALRVHVDEVTGAAMVHDPHRRTLTATAVISHPAFVLLGPADQDRRVTARGRVFAVLAATEQIATVQVLEATIPDTGREVLAHWRQHGADDDTWTSRTYADRSRTPHRPRRGTAPRSASAWICAEPPDRADSTAGASPRRPRCCARTCRRSASRCARRS